MNSNINTYILKETKTAPLAVFRILFGLIMAFSAIRFWYNGWIETLYLEPTFHFHYAWFPFVEVPGKFTYLLFIISGLSAFCVAIGYRYRLMIILFFLSFGYAELMDKTTYLNHYYFVSVVAFILMWLPAHCAYSVDAYRNPSIRAEFVPRWNVDVLKLMLAVVYIYAGFAKLNHDWLFRAMPLTIWLPTKFDVPLLGALMHEKWMHYLFSWAGAIYDLLVVFFLMWNRTRIFAFGAVLIFHILTRILFPIGIFPYVMICSTLIFFSPAFHEKVLDYISRMLKLDFNIFKNGMNANRIFSSKWSIRILTVFMIFQVVLPLRYLVLDENVFWTERAYRYSWRVMLMEKTGYANFKIVDGKSGKRFYVQNEDFLTALQQKQMSTQPDFILEYAQFLGKHFTNQGHENVEVYVESYAALNGRKNQIFVDPNIDLLKVNYKELCKHIHPLNE